MKRLIIIAISLFPLLSVHAQDAATCTDEDFRDWAREIVSKGNRQYDRSYRAGIKQYADSLQSMLEHRQGVGRLMRGDSLEFTADLLKLRADWHYENGNYDAQSYSKAEGCFRDVLGIYEAFSDMPNGLNGLPMIKREMAQLMYKLCRYDEALQYTSDALKAYQSAADNGLFDEELTDSDYITMLDIKTQKAICLARTGKTDEALSLINELLKAYPKASEGYYEVLRKKAKIIMLSGKAGAEKLALPLYKQYFTWRKAEALKMLGTMTAAEREDYWMRTRPFIADCYQLESEDPAFLYDVTLFAKGLLLQLNRMSGHGKASESALNSLRYTWQQVQTKLTNDACAIEFVQYEKLGKQFLAGIVMTKTAAPVWVKMMSPEEFMNYKAFDIATNKEILYSTEGGRKNALYNDPTLQALMWHETLLKAIGSSRKVYFAPDGYLHQVALEYMFPEELQCPDIFRLTSTRRLMEQGGIRTTGALVVGGVNYDAKSVLAHEGNDYRAYEFMHSHSQKGFSYLPGSRIECDTIYAIRGCNKDTLLVGENATELAMRTLCNQYPIINISTHGYFCSAEVPQSTDIKTSMTDESLSQSVIALAGSNTSIANEAYDTSMMDGYLSAKEIAQCDMSNVDLAIISACQTGLGFVTADGVFGIQRGLKDAGVKSIMVTLWSISDEASCLLISQFHNNLTAGLSAHKAFLQARQCLIEQDYDKPQFTHAFILIDAIE